MLSNNQMIIIKAMLTFQLSRHFRFLDPIYYINSFAHRILKKILLLSFFFWSIKYRFKYVYSIDRLSFHLLTRFLSWSLFFSSLLMKLKNRRRKKRPIKSSFHTYTFDAGAAAYFHVFQQKIPTLCRIEWVKRTRI